MLSTCNVCINIYVLCVSPIIISVFVFICVYLVSISVYHLHYHDAMHFFQFSILFLGILSPPIGCVPCAHRVRITLYTDHSSFNHFILFHPNVCISRVCDGFIYLYTVTFPAYIFLFVTTIINTEHINNNSVSLPEVTLYVSLGGVGSFFGKLC